MSIFKETKGLAYVTPGSHGCRLSPVTVGGKGRLRQAAFCTRTRAPPLPPAGKHAGRAERPCLICDIATGICHSRSYS